jgi:hypothetical protein
LIEIDEPTGRALKIDRVAHLYTPPPPPENATFQLPQ